MSPNLVENSAQHRDTAVQIAELLEALAWLVESSIHEEFQAIKMESDPTTLERLGQYTSANVPPTVQDVLDWIGPRIMSLKGWLFDNCQQPSQVSHPGLGAAQLCQYCKWAFQRLARRPNKSGRLPDPFRSCYSPHYLLAIDDWPTFRLLGERSLQGCEFCLFLCEHLPQIVEQPENFDAKHFHTWIEFFWDQDTTRSLKAVKVFPRGIRFFRDSLNLTIHTTHGKFDRGSLTVRIQV